VSILITGASSGIGAACARALAPLCASRNWRLILLARRLDRLQALATELSAQNGVTSHCFESDIRDRLSLETLFSRSEEIFSDTKVLVNSAGLAKGLDPIQRGKVDDWDEMIDTNLKGLLYVTKSLLPHLLRNSASGAVCHIVNIGSSAGHWVYRKGNIYCATKAAVHAFSESLRLDLHGSGIRVTEIVPGIVKTEASKVRFGDEERAEATYAGMVPLSAQDVADAVLWSVSRPAHVNVQELVIFPTAQSAVGMVSRI